MYRFTFRLQFSLFMPPTGRCGSAPPPTCTSCRNCCMFDQRDCCAAAAAACANMQAYIKNNNNTHAAHKVAGNIVRGSSADIFMPSLDSYAPVRLGCLACHGASGVNTPSARWLCVWSCHLALGFNQLLLCERELLLQLQALLRRSVVAADATVTGLATTSNGNLPGAAYLVTCRCCACCYCFIRCYLFLSLICYFSTVLFCFFCRLQLLWVIYVAARSLLPLQLRQLQIEFAFFDSIVSIIGATCVSPSFSLLF